MITQKELKEYLDYNSETGYFIWKIDTGRGRIGEKADYKNNKGYIQIGIKNKFYLAHRLAFLWMEGYLPENGVDHVDRDKTNNKWNNLREVSQSCNAKNRSLRSDNKSNIIGVSWHKMSGKWVSNIKANNKKIHLGLFEDIDMAAKARWEAEVRYGYPNCNTTSSAYGYLKNKNLF